MGKKAVLVLMVLALLLGGVFTALPMGGAGTLAQGPAVFDPSDPGTIPKYIDPLIIPPAMPRTSKIKDTGGKNIDYYEIAVRQFDQQILPTVNATGTPTGFNATTVWSYGSVQFDNSFVYPALTIEAKYNKPVRVKWINDLVDAQGNFLPHLLPVDQTLHWANPPGPVDTRGTDNTTYTGPVPIITHVHGAHTYQESDGYPEAWYLPDALNIQGYNTTGTMYNEFKAIAEGKYGQPWQTGTAVFQYPNNQRATTLWYHDHTLGMTRVNVYAGPAGFYLIRGGPDDMVLDSRGGLATLPGPAPGSLPKAKGGKLLGGPFYEIPIVIQDRSFNSDGSLFYPDNRAFFEGLDPSQLQIPFIPETACDGNTSDVSPIWQPEFFGNTMVVNGKTWPYLNVEQVRYRFRLLNGCNSRFLILKFDAPGVQVWQIGADGGFLPYPLNLTADMLPGGGQILLGPAERADVIVDFTNVPVGNYRLLNWGPDEPYGGGVLGIDFDPADPNTTGQVMEFRVGPALAPDPSTPPQFLVLPPVPPTLAPDVTRTLSLNELMSETVMVTEDLGGNITLNCTSDEPFGPIAAMLGNITGGMGNPLRWMDPITENPAVGAIENWEIFNFTADAHPIHIHLVQFQVVNREKLEVDAEGVALQPYILTGNITAPEPWELGFKDTVIVYPGQVTRVQARFDYEGLYVWHCHIIEHEDNEMMRPYYVGTMP